MNDDDNFYDATCIDPIFDALNEIGRANMARLKELPPPPPAGPAPIVNDEPRSAQAALLEEDYEQ